MDGEKREIRQLKREIKRAGGKKSRLRLKQGLADHPEEAHEDRAVFGRHRSDTLNGIDRDATRQRKTEESEPADDR